MGRRGATVITKKCDMASFTTKDTFWPCFFGTFLIIDLQANYTLSWAVKIYAYFKDPGDRIQFLSNFLNFYF